MVKIVRVAIMQPYFLPYIGYWQLLAVVDKFILYDNIQFTKKGWINRNRFLRNGEAALFTVPVGRGSEKACIVDRTIAESFERRKMLSQFRESYRRAPEFKNVFPLVEAVVMASQSNLFQFIQHSISEVASFLGITTPIAISSSIGIDHNLRAEAKVLALCGAVGASTYINPIGGLSLYSRGTFLEYGVMLQFLRTRELRYTQFGCSFVPNLSILDVMMFNSVPKVIDLLSGYDLL